VKSVPNPSANLRNQPLALCSVKVWVGGVWRCVCVWDGWLVVGVVVCETPGPCDDIPEVIGFLGVLKERTDGFRNRDFF
jgi:hypothetical protein